MTDCEEKAGVSAKTPQVNSLTDTQYGAQGHNSCCFRGGDDHTDRHDLRAEIRKGLHAFYTDGDAIELRILDGSKVGSCYYTSFEALINDVLRLERSKKHKTYNYFTTINEIDRDATLRRNTLKWGREAQPTTADSDIAARRGFFIDCDPSRKSGISASEDEKNSAWTLCSVVDEYLVSKGLPHGAICDSGNGFHLRHITDGSIGVDAESTTLLADFLEAIDAARKVDGVTIDKTVVNPARICKLYGTEARKGVSDPATTRVHRYSRVLSVPAEPVTRAMIERVVNEYRAAKPTKDTPSTGSFDMRGWLDSHNIAVARVKAMPDGGTKYILETCPFNPDHTNGSAFVIVKPNGARIAGCRHNSCSGNDWYTLRNMYDDDYVRVQSTTARQDYIKEWYDSPKTYRTNESIAKLFYQVFDGAIVFSHELNEWLLYNGKYWEIDTRHHVYNMLIDLLYDVVDVIDKAKPLESDEEGLKRWKEQKSWVVRQKNRRPLDDTLHIAQKKMARPLSDFDAHDTYLNVLNGTVDLVSGEIRNHTPTDYLTRICDVEFHPSAAFERWDSLLLESLGREEYVRYLQREMGYAINGISNEELLIMLYGEASTGKSTFYESVMGVLGTNGDGYGAYVGFSTFYRTDKSGGAPREDLLRLRTARIAMCSEVNENTHFDTSLVKKICSGEELVARGIRARNSFSFKPRFTVVLGTNYAPKIPHDDGGAYRRIKVNPFLCPVSEDRQDKTLKAQFETKEAKERILAWLVEGSVAWHRDGLGQEPREVTRANSEYRRDQNPLKEFIEDYCVADRRAVDGVHGSRLENIREQYNRECWRYHLDQLNNRSFGSYMKSLGYAVQRKRVEDKKNPVRYYDGIRLKTQVEIADEVEFNAVNERYDAEEREEYETATSSSLAFLYLSVHGRESDAVPCTVYKALFTYSTHLKVDTNLKLVTLHDMWGICENDLPNGTRYTPPPQATQIDTMQSVLRSVIQHVSTADEYALLSDERRLAVIREQTIAQTAQRLNERADHTRQLFDLLLRNDTGFQAQLIPFGGGAWPR